VSIHSTVDLANSRFLVYEIVHNSFARSDPFHLEDNQPQSESEDAYHFITYLPINGQLFVRVALLPASEASLMVERVLRTGSSWMD